MIAHFAVSILQESCWLNKDTLLTMSTNADFGLTTRDSRR
jgi:hypothetical protein